MGHRRCLYQLGMNVIFSIISIASTVKNNNEMKLGNSSIG